MVQSKIDVSIGDVSFSGEGEQEWLAEQLERVLKAAPHIADAKPRLGNSLASTSDTHTGADFKTSLASYIKEKGGDGSQVDRFLITADWLRRRGIGKLTTGAVSKALKDNQQKRLANPADCLNKNVSKGYCEKSDGGFFVTPDGLKKLGYR